MLTDTHCHLDFDKFDDDRDEVIRRALDVGLTRILIPALDLDSSWAAIKLADSHPMLYAAIGFHPTDLEKWNEHSINDLRELISPHPSPLSQRERGTRCEFDFPLSQGEGHGKGKIVAIGEIGLDYYWVKETDKRAHQRAVLKQQLLLAQELNKPIILHMREENDAWIGQASQDLLEILSEWHKGLTAQNNPIAERPGVLHSFNGNLETAQKALALNFYIGVTGPITYKNADEKRQIFRQLPLERLLIETDAPFLTPVPHRGKRNEPAFVRHIADKIAEIQSCAPQEVAAVTTANAARLFSWGETV